jgi:hypothetical protein
LASSQQISHRAIPFYHGYQHTSKRSEISFEIEESDKILNLTEAVAFAQRLSTNTLERNNKTSIDNLDVLKGSPLLGRKSRRRGELAEVVCSIYKAKLYRAFDMVFLSRAACPDAFTSGDENQSLTFDFSREEVSAGSQEDVMGNTFGTKQVRLLCNLSAIE